MQNPTLMNISPISERILALIAEGVGHFSAQEDISNCQKCVLSRNRKKVLVAESTIPKSFFILSEYPDIEDESSKELFNAEGSSAIILNLIRKLGIEQDCHFSFSLKCVPHKTTPQMGLNTCITQHLLKEISRVSPKTIFCFGSRTFYALSALDPNLFYQAHMPEKNGDLEQSKAFNFTLNGETIALYLLPTAQELKQFPQWRAPVWMQLAHFKKNIDS